MDWYGSDNFGSGSSSHTGQRAANPHTYGALMKSYVESAGTRSFDDLFDDRAFVATRRTFSPQQALPQRHRTLIPRGVSYHQREVRYHNIQPADGVTAHINYRTKYQKMPARRFKRR